MRCVAVALVAVLVLQGCAGRLSTPAAEGVQPAVYPPPASSEASPGTAADTQGRGSWRKWVIGGGIVAVLVGGALFALAAAGAAGAAAAAGDGAGNAAAEAGRPPRTCEALRTC
jgi:hypothetical protein